MTSAEAAGVAGVPAGERALRAAGMMDRLVGLDPDEITGIDRLLPGLGYRDGALVVAGSPARELLEAHGSPLLVYDVARVRDNVRTMTDAFEARLPDVRVLYALKACYVRDVVRGILETGAGIEVQSDVELQVARHLGCGPERLSSNGLGRTSAYNASVADARPFLTVVDAASDLDGLEAALPADASPLPVAVRVTPQLEDGGMFDAGGSKLGSDWADGSFDALVDRCLASTRVRVVGVHAHLLTHCVDVEQYRAAVRGVVDVAIRTERRTGRRMEVLDIGGGFETRFLMERSGVSIDDFAAVAGDEIERLGHDVQVVVEPGRWAVADAGVALCTVGGTKVNSGRRWLITDIGASLLIPIPELVYHPVPVDLTGTPQWSEHAVGDSTCDAQDVLCSSASLPACEVGDALALLNCGAYTTVFSSAWGHRLPNVIVADRGELRTVFDLEAQTRFWEALHGVPVEFR
jgi:diaminopimelate decarboxylase